MNPTLLSGLALLHLGGAVAAASTTDNDSVIIDMAGYEGVIFFTTVEGSLNNGVATATVQQNALDQAAGMASLSGAVATLTSQANDDLNGQFLAIDVYRPRERFLRLKRTSSAANIAFGPVIALRYGQRKLPTDDTEGIGSFVSVTSPAEA